MAFSKEYVLGLVAKFEAEADECQRQFEKARSEKAKQSAWNRRCDATRAWNKWNAYAWEHGFYA